MQIHGGVLVSAFVGVALVLAGAATLRRSGPQLARKKRAELTPTVRIAQAQGGGIVAIEGRVLPTSAGAFASILTQQPIVWGTMTLFEALLRGGRRQVWDQREARPFFVDDGSGQCAVVLPEGATLVAEARDSVCAGLAVKPTPSMDHFLRSRGYRDPLPKSWHVTEAIGAGDVVYAIGPSRRDAGQLVLFAASPAFSAGELLVGSDSKGAMLRRLTGGRVWGWILLGVGAPLAAIGLLAAVSMLASC